MRRCSPQTKVTVKKTLGFVARIPLGPLGGELHSDRWPGRSCFKADPVDIHKERQRLAKKGKKL